MNFVKNFNFYGTNAKEIPCIEGNGAPNTTTEGAVGCFYMNKINGEVYLCVGAQDGVYTWTPFEASGSSYGLQIAHIFNRTVPGKNFSTSDEDYVVFASTFQSFDNAARNTGYMYAMSERPGYSSSAGTSRPQRFYRSKDGGETWELLGSRNTFIPENYNSLGQWGIAIYVDATTEYFYILETTNGLAQTANRVVVGYFSEGTFYSVGTPLLLGTRLWLSNTNSIDSAQGVDPTKRIVMIAEYGTYLYDEDPTYRIWRSMDGGASWAACLEFEGDSGTLGTGEIRHFHCVQRDPWTIGTWWAAAGDENSQCKIFRTQNDGDTWEQVFPLAGQAGSQRERTCSFVIDKEYIYYGMDTPTVGENGVKLFKFKKSDIGATDTSGNPIDPRVEIGTVADGYPVYCLTKVDWPEGFIVWSVYEKSTGRVTNKHTVQFYDYATGRLYPIGTFDTKTAMEAGYDYVGFTSASRFLDKNTGTGVVMPHFSMEQERYGYTIVSRHVKFKVTS